MHLNWGELGEAPNERRMKEARIHRICFAWSCAERSMKPAVASRTDTHYLQPRGAKEALWISQGCRASWGPRPYVLVWYDTAHRRWIEVRREAHWTCHGFTVCAGIIQQSVCRRSSTCFLAIEAQDGTGLDLPTRVIRSYRLRI